MSRVCQARTEAFSLCIYVCISHLSLQCVSPRKGHSLHGVSEYSSLLCVSPRDGIYMHTCIQAHTYIYTCVYVRMYVYTHTHTHVCVCVCVHTNHTVYTHTTYMPVEGLRALTATATLFKVLYPHTHTHTVNTLVLVYGGVHARRRKERRSAGYREKGWNGGRGGMGRGGRGGRWEGGVVRKGNLSRRATALLYTPTPTHT